MRRINQSKISLSSIYNCSTKADGTWEQAELARLPGEPEGHIRMENGDIAVLSGGSVVMLSQKTGILGVATCVHK
jgi:hypothetical protein